MLAAVYGGDTKKLAELIRQDPGFNVNMDQDGNGWTLLHHACARDSRSPVIPLLLAHPDIDVNVKESGGHTPFYLACCGRPSCVREMLKDSRVNLNEPNKYGCTHSGLLLIVTALMSSSGGLCPGGRSILGQEGMSTRRMPWAWQGGQSSKKWWPCWRDSKVKKKKRKEKEKERKAAAAVAVVVAVAVATQVAAASRKKVKRKENKREQESAKK